jgi:hypothetical protein
MPNDLKPPLDEITHHGIKGMHWGVRKQSTSGSENSNFKRNAKRVGAGVLVVGGAAAAVYILSKNGKVPATVLKPAFSEAHAKQMNMVIDAQRVAAAKAGRDATRTLNNQVWSKKVGDIMKSIDEANASQDQWMRSVGLGKVVNNAS